MKAKKKILPVVNEISLNEQAGIKAGKVPGIVALDYSYRDGLLLVWSNGEIVYVQD